MHENHMSRVHVFVSLRMLNVKNAPLKLREVHPIVPYKY